jgi:hypothetical protein
VLGKNAFLVSVMTFIACGLSPFHGVEAGGVSIAPKRIVFEGRERSAEVAIFNQDSKPVTYRISFKEMVMTPEGGLAAVESSAAERKSSDLVKFSPRQVTIASGGRQVVRLMLRKPQELPVGEYRSHMLFVSLPDSDSINDVNQVAEAGSGVSVSMIPQFGISIPVVVRHGEDSTKVTMSDLHAGPSSVGLTLSRQGEFSLYGAIDVVHVSPSGAKRNVGAAKGVALYWPNTSRYLRVPLDANPLALGPGRLELQFSESRPGGRPITARAALNLP